MATITDIVGIIDDYVLDGNDGHGLAFLRRDWEESVKPLIGDLNREEIFKALWKSEYTLNEIKEVARLLKVSIDETFT